MTWDSSRAAPKPLRGPRAAAKQAKRIARRAELKKASAKKTRTEYGGRGWLAFRHQILSRDGYRCQWCRQLRCQPLHVHHLARVGMGGSSTANVPENVLTLGDACHASHHDGHEPTREQLRDRMVNLGHIVILTPAELDDYEAAISRFTGVEK